MEGGVCKGLGRGSVELRRLDIHVSNGTCLIPLRNGPLPH